MDLDRETICEEELAVQRIAYETRTDSLRALAEEFGVSPTTLRRRADRDGWTRAPGAPPCGPALMAPPHGVEAWRQRLHMRLRRLLERYVEKLEAWLVSPDEASVQSPADDRWVGRVYRIIEVLALNIGHAKDSPANRVASKT